MKQSATRQAAQSLLQFLTIFFTGMLVYDKVPTDINQLWQPTVQGILGALGIWTASKIPVGGPENLEPGPTPGEGD